MPELTLESLAARVLALERKLAPVPPSVLPPSRNWQSVVGISEETEFSKAMRLEMEAFRNAEWNDASEEAVDDPSR